MHRIALIPGDGIGPEIIREGRKVLDRASERFGFDIEWQGLDLGAERYLATGKLLTEQDLAALAGCRAIYFGAIGDERVAPGILEKGILLALRFHFDQYVNLRPVRLLHGVWTPLADKTPDDIDFVVVRENTEDFYVGIGSRFRGRERKNLEVVRELYHLKFGLDVESDADEIAYQIGVISREGAERVIRYAFELARARRRKLTSVDKANVLTDIYGLWREVFAGEAKKYPDVNTEFNFVDAITMWFVKNPEWFDVVVTPNMFGD
ncbi:MAG: 3-isopropylmalate dehydrogenase, partial [Methanomicrobiales archaeon]|nr:3-isopropylmalate dehydrogenase [Methanomicrobiales archaeon]